MQLGAGNCLLLRPVNRRRARHPPALGISSHALGEHLLLSQATALTGSMTDNPA
ncbi:MAG: hypothetical protein JO202_01685 [Ktedonobacteraceae bacterium]|nr:hypothetical protein [Ktedonobacteraceae bacterium]